jgi:hypothetical protein
VAFDAWLSTLTTEDILCVRTHLLDGSSGWYPGSRFSIGLTQLISQK